MLIREVAEQGRGRGRGMSRSLSLLSVPTLFLILSFAILSFAPFSPPANGQTAATAERTLITRVEPEYPDTLKRLYIGGTVRIEAVVAADGTVESTQLIGGNPILGQTAMRAIKQWKYARGKAKETVIVKLEFDPHS
jgi:TonB family protein